MFISDSRFSFPSTHRFTTTWLTLPRAGALASNRNQRTPILFGTKGHPAFFSWRNFRQPSVLFFFFALISVLSMSFCDNVCSACSIYSVRQPSTAFARQNSKEWLLPHRPETTPQRSVTAASAPLRSACHCINPPPSPIVAAVGGGGPILARR